MRQSIQILGLLLGLALASCSDGSGDGAAAGGLTEGEMQQLERAAERIDAQAPSPAKAESEALEADVRAKLSEELRIVESR